MKGFLALDIDGTITDDPHHLPQQVATCLVEMHNTGWELIFLTGRNFQWAYSVLKHLSSPYLLALQNGALVLAMPERKILSTCYLDQTVLKPLEAICQEVGTDFIIYSGFEFGDVCYYRPKNFSQKALEYLQYRTELLKENWVAVDNFEHLPTLKFASIKFIEKWDLIQKIVLNVEETLHLHIPLNRDPVDESYFVAQATRAEANKGQVLNKLLAEKSWKGPVIAAGDDASDLSMLKEATIKIAMANAPKELLAIADVIAPPASLNGIVTGLHHALALVKIKGCK